MTTISINEHRARIGDALKAAFDAYVAAHGLTGTATWDIQVTVTPTAAQVTIDRKALLRALLAARVAVSTDPTRYYLGGILLERRGAVLHVVGCNGHILVETPLSCEAGSDVSVVLSDIRSRGVTKTKTGVARMIAALRASRVRTVTLILDANTIALDTARYPTIDCSYPDWRRVLPYWKESATITLAARDVQAMCAKGAARATVLDETGATAGDIHMAAQAVTGRPFRTGIATAYLRGLARTASESVAITVGTDRAGGPMQIDCGDGVRRIAVSLRV